MITNSMKQNVCKKNSDILGVIWLLGKGIMYKKHIESYMEHFFELNPKDTWKRVKELEVTQVVERVRLHNIIVIKLKKYALRFLLGVHREAIRSIEVTASKLMRSAYINAVILSHLKEISGLKQMDYASFVKRYVPNSTFFSMRNQSFGVLNRIAEKGILFGNVHEEIARLKAIQKKSIPTKSRIKKEESEWIFGEYKFNLNSMEQASVFLDFTQKGEKVTLNFALLDDKNNLSGSRIAEKIMKTYSYFHNFVQIGTEFKFTVYVPNRERLKSLQNKSNTKAYNDFIAKKSRIQSIVYHPQNCKLNYVNLELDKRLFGNQSLFINGNIHSRKQKDFGEKWQEP